MSSRLAASGLFAWALAGVGCASAPVGPAAPAPAAAAEASPAPDFSRQVLVTLAPAPERIWSRTTAELAAAHGLDTAFFWPLPSLGEDCIIYDLPPGKNLAQVVRRLAADPRVTLAQPVRLFRGEAAPYNDPYAHLQVGLKALNLERAHELATGRGVKVAIVDTGVDLAHPDLAGRIIEASNFITWGPSAFTSDVHGTAVAGIVAADANNQVGIVGVAPRAEILALKACWQDPPESREAVCNTYTLAQALDFALRNGAKVLNLSLAGPDDPLVAKLIGKALAAGITVVAAAGSRAAEGFPASFPGVLAVRAADPTGRATPPAPTPSLAAPGVDVLTTIPRGSYDFFSGSSMAAAQVSGIVALLLERRPELTPAEVHEILFATAPGVDACAALARVVEGVGCE